MKFLIIAYSDVDGVGQHVISLNKNLKRIGHESQTILLHKSENDESLTLVKRSIFKRLIFFFQEFLKKDFKRLFSFGNSTINFKDIKNYIEKSDIIIIYTLHKIISLKMLNKIFESRKIIYMRPLDMELAAGGCHVNTLPDGSECQKFETDCKKCPLLNSLNIFDLSNNIFNKKKIIIEKYKPKIFLENNFTRKIYTNSPITKNAFNHTIFLGVNTDRIKKISKIEARKFLGLDLDEKLILFGTYNLDAPHKGGKILPDILKKFTSILIDKDIISSSKIRLITFGRKNSFNIGIPNLAWTHLGMINSNDKLNHLYRASDIFASPSTGCNGPHVILEALLNDLPVVAFDQGVAQDSVIDGLNGYLVPCFNIDIFANSVFKSIFLNNFNFNDEKNKNLKNVFNSLNEAKTLVEFAEEDYKKKYKQ